MTGDRLLQAAQVVHATSEPLRRMIPTAIGRTARSGQHRSSIRGVRAGVLRP
jgi:hypothetical protein